MEPVVEVDPVAGGLRHSTVSLARAAARPADELTGLRAARTTSIVPRMTSPRIAGVAVLLALIAAFALTCGLRGARVMPSAAEPRPAATESHVTGSASPEERDRAATGPATPRARVPQPTSADSRPRVRVTVVDPGGRGAAGAHVEVYEFGNQCRRVSAGVTSADGVVVLDATVDAVRTPETLDWGTVLVTARRGDLAAELRDVRAARSDPVDARLVLAEGLLLRGQVIDETGAAVAGAVVEAGADPGVELADGERAFFRSAHWRARTEADGTFTIAPFSLDAEETVLLRLWVSADGCMPRNVDVAATERNVRVEMERSRTVTGRVIDVGGHVVPRFLVYLDSGAVLLSPGGGRGNVEFEVACVRPGAAVVQCAPVWEGAAAAEISWAAGPPGVLDIGDVILRAPQRRSGRCRWSDGTPAAGALVSARFPRTRLLDVQTTADDDGRFAFEAVADLTAEVTATAQRAAPAAWALPAGIRITGDSRRAGVRPSDVTELVLVERPVLVLRARLDDGTEPRWFDDVTAFRCVGTGEPGEFALDHTDGALAVSVAAPAPWSVRLQLGSYEDVELTVSDPGPFVERMLTIVPKRGK